MTQASMTTGSGDEPSGDSLFVCLPFRLCGLTSGFYRYTWWRGRGSVDKVVDLPYLILSSWLSVCQTLSNLV